MRSARELPRPARALDLLASRWQLPRVEVARYWADFIAASGGLYTLSRASAVETLLAHLPRQSVGLSPGTGTGTGTSTLQLPTRGAVSDAWPGGAPPDRS